MFSDIHDCFCFLFCSCVISLLSFFICVLIISLLDVQVFLFLQKSCFDVLLVCLRGEKTVNIYVPRQWIFFVLFTGINYKKFTLPMINKQSGNCVKTQFLVNHGFVSPRHLGFLRFKKLYNKNYILILKTNSQWWLCFFDSTLCNISVMYICKGIVLNVNQLRGEI